MNTKPKRFWFALITLIPLACGAAGNLPHVGPALFNTLVWPGSDPFEAIGNPASSVGPADQSPAPLQQYAALPLYFEPNLGQTDSQVKFMARCPGYRAYLLGNEMVIVVNRVGETPTIRSSGSELPTLEQTAVRMKLSGANRTAAAKGLERQRGVSAYFIGNDPRQWQPEVPHYGRVVFEGVYPGVDLVYRAERQNLEYDFVVAPNADPSQIRLAYEGTEGLRMNESGDLVLTTGLGEIVQHKPHVFQDVAGGQVEVAANYRLETDGVRFELAAYDRSRALVIDPRLTPVYISNLGGNSVGYGLSIAVDANGSAYVAGFTTASNFASTNTHTYQSWQGSWDAFVTKLEPNNGSGPLTLTYQTYLGGSGADRVQSIAVDTNGAAYATIRTSSTNYPVLNAYQTTYGGGDSDAAVTKLNPYAGSGPVTLDYSTYLGGGSSDEVGGIAVDPTGAAYVAGRTMSTNFPVWHAFQSQMVIGPYYRNDAFLTKFNPHSGAGLVTLGYSTFFGGLSADGATGVAVDSAGAAYVVGYTSAEGLGTNASPNFPLAGAYQGAYQGGPGDGFVAKFNPNDGASGLSLAYSTYLGGGSDDSAMAIAVDSSGNAYVVGYTASANFPKVNAYQSDYSGRVGGMAFLTKLSPGAGGGVTVAYSTYLGGSTLGHYSADATYQQDIANSVAVDTNGAAYVVGATQCTDFPTTNAYQLNNASGYDAFLAKLVQGTGGGLTLAYSTYLGGSIAGLSGNPGWYSAPPGPGDDFAYGVVVGPDGAAYLTGETRSGDLALVNAYATTRQKNGSPFVAKFVLSNTTTYEEWASQISNGLTNYTDCTLGDGYPNLLKYAAGSSPTVPDTLARVTGSVTNGALAFQFNRNPGAVDVTIIVQATSDLMDSYSWSGVATNVNGSWGGATNVTESFGVTPARVTIRDASSPGTQRFLRLLVTRP